jgi:hypothetical protein
MGFQSKTPKSAHKKQLVIESQVNTQKLLMEAAKKVYEAATRGESSNIQVSQLLKNKSTNYKSSKFQSPRVARDEL